MNKELFEKYFNNKFSKEEFYSFVAWLKEEAGSFFVRDAVKDVWNNYDPIATDEDKLKYNRILDLIHHKIHVNRNKILLVQEKRANSFYATKIYTFISRAAVMLIIPLLALLIITNLPEKKQMAIHSNHPDYIEIVSPVGSKTIVELADGTKVWLNHGSKLKYPQVFSGKKRQVSLSGEAYFDVALNNNIPFIVNANQVEIKATGTEFNVMAYPDENRIETTLVSGKVIVYSKVNNQYREIESLSPNQMLKFNLKEHTYSIQSDEMEKYISWKDGLLIFKNDRLDEIARRLSRWYNVDIVFKDDRTRDFTYTAKFANETLEQILELLEKATPISYKLTSREKLPDGSFSKRKVFVDFKN